MTSEQVISKFKEKGIEVIVYEDKIRGILDCTVDTTKHDKQIKAEAINECIKLANSRAWLVMPQLTEAMEQLKESK